MAVAPTTRSLGLTRDQLATFLKDHEQIKQFEALFSTVDDEVSGGAVTDANTLAGNAYAIGNEALAGIAALNDLVAPLAAAPPPTNGTVISVAASGGTTGMTFSGSPITTSGTLTLDGTLAVANGGTGQTSYTDGQLLIGNTTGNTLTKATLIAGSGVSITNGAGSITISATGSGGTVTSVNLTAGTGISVSGGPITTSGSINVVNTAPDQIVSLTGAGTTSITGTYPNFTITSNDAFVGTVTSVSGTGTVNGITLTGTVTTSGSLTLGGTLSGVSLTSQVTGTLPVTNGGTGTATSFTAGSVVFAGASGVYSQDNSTFFWDTTNKRLGLGNTDPGYRLDISSADTTAGIGYAARLRSNATAGAAAFQFTDSGVTAQNGIIIVSDTGLMKFQADGASSAIIFYLGSGTERFRIGVAGQIGLNGTNYGTSGQVLTSQGASSAPTWATPTTGTVTSVGGTGTVNGITLTGTVTSSGSLTLGGTLGGIANSQLTNSSITINGSAISLGGSVSVGTVTSVGGTGTVNGITLTGTVTSSGSLSLGGTLSGVSLTSQVSGTLPVANGGTGVTTSTGSGSTVLSSQPSFGSTIGVGGASASASGAGISFPASQSASTDPNTLDDYEEGSCTITIQDSAGNSATMGGGNVFRYVKIGAFVQVSGTLNWTSTAALSAGSRIQFHGLPFVVNNVGNYRAPALIGSSAGGSFNITRAEIAGGADNGNTFIYGTRVSGNNVDGSMVPSDLGSSGTVYGFQINYTTTF
jgi:hypothetical protein